MPKGNSKAPRATNLSPLIGYTSCMMYLWPSFSEMLLYKEQKEIQSKINKNV